MFKITKLIRSSRRSVALIIDSQAQLIVRAPRAVPLFFIDDLVQKKAAWIESQMRKMLSRPRADIKKFETGEQFLFLGKAYCLKVIERGVLELKDELLLPAKYLSKARGIIIAWYKRQAKRYLSARAKQLAQIMAVQYTTLKISSASGSWGSCGYRQSLNFNWRLMMAPPQIIDYVITHELSHLLHRNHSFSFWQLVAKFCPQYRQARLWLRENGEKIKIS